MAGLPLRANKMDLRKFWASRKFIGMIYFYYPKELVCLINTTVYNKMPIFDLTGLICEWLKEWTFPEELGPTFAKLSIIKPRTRSGGDVEAYLELGTRSFPLRLYLFPESSAGIPDKMDVQFSRPV